MYSTSKQSTKHNSTSVKWVYIYSFGVNLIYMLEQFTRKRVFCTHVSFGFNKKGLSNYFTTKQSYVITSLIHFEFDINTSRQKLI